MRLFVYGTLLAGGENHAMLEGARFISRARTEARFDLVDLGPYPALVRGGNVAVRGEIYEVDAAVLEKLDTFEGHPDLYVREAVELEGGKAEAYVFPAASAMGRPRIASGAFHSTRARTTTE